MQGLKSHQDKLDLLQKWATEHGSFTENIRLVATKENGILGIMIGVVHRGGYAKKNIGVGQVICSVSDKLCFTESLARQSDIGRLLEKHLSSLGEWESDNPLDPHAKGVLYMIAMMIDEWSKEKDSFWYPYLNCLPESFDEIPLNWSLEERNLLNGTNLGFLMEKRLELLRKGFTILESLAEMYPNLENFRKTLSFERFMWAFCSISSRAFPKLEATQTHSTGEVCLYPFIDMLNHKRAQKIEWNTSALPNQVSFVALEKVDENREVFNNYGAKGNENLLGNYGFCLIDNPEDYFKLPLNVSEKDPLKKAKLTKLNANGLSLVHLLFATDESLSVKLLQTLDILVNSENTLEFTKRNRLNCLNSLFSLLHLKYQQLLQTSPSQVDEKVAKVSINTRNALIYRSGQKKVLEHTFELIRKEADSILQSSVFVCPRNSQFQSDFCRNLYSLIEKGFDIQDAELLPLVLDQLALPQEMVQRVVKETDPLDLADEIDTFEQIVLPILEDQSKISSKTYSELAAVSAKGGIMLGPQLSAALGLPETENFIWTG